MNTNVIRFDESLIKKILVFLSVSFTVFISGSFLLAFGDFISGNIIRILFFMLILINLLLILIYGCDLRCFTKIRDNLIMGIILLVLFVFFNFVRIPSSLIHLGTRLLWFLSFFIICCYREKLKIEFLATLYTLILVLAVISLFLFITINILSGSIPLKVYNIDRIQYYSFLDVYYMIPSAKINFFGKDIYRIQSLFWEPGVFSVHLTFSLFYALFIRKHWNKIQIIIIYVCILLTFSTTGICCGSVLLLIYLFTSKKTSKGIKRFFLVTVLPIALFFIFRVWQKKKIEGEDIKFSSYSVRMADLVLGVNLLLQNPILGTGYNNDSVYRSIFKNMFGVERGSSNGLITWFYTTGLLGIFLAFFPFIRNIFNNKKEITAIIYLGLFLILNMTEPLFLTPIMMFHLANAWATYSNYKKNISNDTNLAYSH